MLKPGQRSDFQICLSDPRGRKPEWYLQLENGFASATVDFLAEDAQNIYINNVGKRIGDFDEQRDWKGGRGGERFDDDPSKFWDSLNCWTLSTGHVTPTLLWQYGTGYRNALTYLPGSGRSVSWKALTGSTRYIASDALEALTAADKAKVWLRRVGKPGTCTVELRAADSALPNGAVRKSATVTTSTITDKISVFQAFDWTGTQNVTAGDFLVIYGASTDTLQNHWEVGVDSATTDSKQAADGANWSNSSFSLYYRITDADTARRWFFFHNGLGFAAVDKKDSGNSEIYAVNTTGVWGGTAAAGLGTVTGRPVTGDANLTFFPQGESTNIRTWDGATTFGDDGTNKATFLVKGQDVTAGSVIWRANTAAGTTSSVSRATVGASLTFGTAIPLGSSTGTINGMAFWSDNGLYVFKNDSAWKLVNVGGNDQATKLQWGLENTPSSANGVFALAHQQFLYFPWLFSLERLYGTQLDDVGQGWEGAGLPDGREGSFVSGCAYVNFQFYALDAGTSGTSCVMCYDGVVWSEIFRAPEAGQRIRDVAIQPIEGERAKLWIDCGGDLIYMILPKNKARPIDDDSCMYQHEGVLYSSTIDAGAASKLPKLIKSITATTANLDGSGKRIEVDYQVDDNIGKDGFENWIPLDALMLSPESTVAVNAANITQFRYRMRLITDNNLIPPDLKGVVPNGLARGGTRAVYSMMVKGDKVTSGGKTTDPNELLKYLMEAQENPGSVMMTSTNTLFCGEKNQGVPVELSLQRVQPITDTKSAFVLNLVAL